MAHPTSLPANAAVTAVALHDFNGDRRAEIIDATRTVENDAYCTGLQFVARNADGSEQLSTLWREVSRDPVVSLSIADLNHDGHDDLIALRQHGGLLLFAGSAEGFTRDLSVPTPPEQQSCQAFDSGIADLDGDGVAELIVSYAGDESGDEVLRCDEGGGFSGWRIRAALAH